MKPSVLKIKVRFRTETPQGPIWQEREATLWARDTLTVTDDKGEVVVVTTKEGRKR